MQRSTTTNSDAPEAKRSEFRSSTDESPNGTFQNQTPRRNNLRRSSGRSHRSDYDAGSIIPRYALHFVIVLLVIGGVGFFGFQTLNGQGKQAKVASQVATGTKTPAATVQQPTRSSQVALAVPSSDRTRVASNRGGRDYDPSTPAEEALAAKAAVAASADVTPTATPTQETQPTATPTEQATQPADQAQIATTPPEPAPQEKHEITKYVVQPGDSIYGIAAAHGISVDTVLWANNLDESALIQPGQELTILPTDGIKYTVQEGDSLVGIAQEYGVDPNAVATYNNIADPSMLSVGAEIIIPGASPKAGAPAAAPEAPAPQPAAQEAAPEPQPAPAPKPEATPAPAPAAEPAPAPQPEPAAQAAQAPAEEPAPAPPSDGSVGQRIVDIAMQYVGVPYVWGGASPAGFDCTGLVYYSYRKAGIPLPRTAEGMAAAGPRISMENLLPGDIVLFQGTYKPGLSHAGIYIGNGQFINAVTYGVGVKVDSLYSSYYSSHWWGGVRAW